MLALRAAAIRDYLPAGRMFALLKTNSGGSERSAASQSGRAADSATTRQMSKQPKEKGKRGRGGERKPRRLLGMNR